MIQFFASMFGVFILLLLLSFPSTSTIIIASPLITPVQEVQIETEESSGEKPPWKRIWDVAREHARINEFDQAKKWYEKLLELKPNIQESQWEYAKLLIQLNDYESASWVLDGLLEIERNNVEYLTLAGTVALKNQRYKKALKYLGQAYEANPGGNDYKVVLKGLIDGFKGVGNERSALLAMEQYYRYEKNDQRLLNELATLSQRLGLLEKARMYYAALIEEYSVDAITVYNAALVNDQLGLEEEATVYWKKYLTYDENAQQALERLANYHIQLDQFDLALPYLLQLDSINSGSSTELAIRIGDIYYRILGRPDKGLYYYERYSRNYPDDEKVGLLIEKIRSSLAENYLPIVENDGAGQLWLDLDFVTLDRSSLFFEMAELAKKNENIGQEIALLQILFENTQDDLDLGFRLAKLYLANGSYESANTLFNLLEQQSYRNSQYLVLMAETQITIGEEKKGLLSYKKYLRSNMEDVAIIEKALEIAGELGLVDDLQGIWDAIPEQMKRSQSGVDLGFTYIEALWKIGFFSIADNIYQEMAERSIGDERILAQIQLHKAESLYRQESVFEAESNIRQVLAKNIFVNEALEKLVRLSLAEGQLSWARTWFLLLAARFDIADIERDDVALPDPLHFLYLDILIAEKEYKEAEISILKRKQHSQLVSELYLVRTYYLSADYIMCRQKIDQLLSDAPENIELMVMSQLVDDELSGDPRRQHQDLTGEGRKLGFSALLKKAQLFLRYRSFSRAQDVIEIALRQIPQSLSAKLIEIEIFASRAMYEEALTALVDIRSSYPGQDFFSRKQLQLEFKSGKFKKIVESLPSQPEEEVLSEEGTFGVNSDKYFWEKLLLARTLWAENRKEEAIKVYDSLLAIPVDTVFLERVEVENVNFHLPPLKKSFWNRITFTNPAQPDPITTVMDPHFVGKNIGQPIDDIAASLYSKYRWQKLIKKELSARQASENRDYYRAEKEYRSLIKEEKTQETLIDLAGIYNRLEQYGKEAELYERMQSEGQLYPGLDEYIESNALKRQPRVMSTFTNSTRLRRDGFVDMKKKAYGLEGWLMPTLDQEVSLSVFHNTYESYDNSRKLWSNRLIGTYSTFFEDKFDMNLSVGSNRPTGPGNSELLMNFELIGLLSDTVQGYGRFRQDLVEDSIDSVYEAIIYRDFDFGVKIDLFPRLFAGADFRFRQYSDDNDQNRYKLWSLYHLFGDVNQFKVRYSYENTNSNSDNTGRPYWSPTTHWEHLFTVHYKHLFAEEYRPESPLSYCTFEYSYGFESGNEQSHTFDLNIFLEINRHFLLKGNFTNHNGDDYRETEAALSLIYRW